MPLTWPIINQIFANSLPVDARVNLFARGLCCRIVCPAPTSPSLFLSLSNLEVGGATYMLLLPERAVAVARSEVFELMSPDVGFGHNAVIFPSSLTPNLRSKFCLIKRTNLPFNLREAYLLTGGLYCTSFKLRRYDQSPRLNIAFPPRKSAAWTLQCFDTSA